MLTTVGILIIAEEILQNKKSDCESDFLIQELNSLQFTINKITVIRNNESTIFSELELLIKTCDIIIAISKQCSTLFRAIGGLTGQVLRKNEDLLHYFIENKKLYKEEDVLLPLQAKVIFDCAVFPVVHFQRIFMVHEEHLKDSFGRILKEHLAQYRRPRIFQRILQISQNGNSVEDLIELSKLSSAFVTVDFNRDDHSFVFKFSSSHLSKLTELLSDVKEKFESYQVKFLDDCNEWGRVYASKENHIRNSIQHIEHCLEQYGLDNIFISFNGGKDCTVLLHLLLTVIKKKYPQYSNPILCMYVQSDDPFPEQDKFINQAKCYYNLKISTVRSGIKDALQQTLHNFPNYRACFMGTRRTDPHSEDMVVFQMTDSNWPQVMRVSPLLDWHYSDIWDYLLFYNVPYCELYDLGYTSLGNTVNTTRNPSLMCYDKFKGAEVYEPAFKLVKETMERNGRNSS